MGERVQVQGHLMVLLRSGDRTFATRGHGLERRRPSPFLIILCRVVVSVRIQNTRFLERRLSGSPFLIVVFFYRECASPEYVSWLYVHHAEILRTLFRIRRLAHHKYEQCLATYFQYLPFNNTTTLPARRRVS